MFIKFSTAYSPKMITKCIMLHKGTIYRHNRQILTRFLLTVFRCFFVKIRVNTQSIHCGFALKTPEKQCVKNSPNLKLLKICDFLGAAGRRNTRVFQARQRRKSRILNNFRRVRICRLCLKSAVAVKSLLICKPGKAGFEHNSVSCVTSVAVGGANGDFQKPCRTFNCHRQTVAV